MTDKDILEEAKEEIRKSNTGIIRADGKCFVVLKKETAINLIAELEKVKGEVEDLQKKLIWRKADAQSTVGKLAEMLREREGNMDGLVQKLRKKLYKAEAELEKVKKEREGLKEEMAFINSEYVNEEDSKLTWDAQALKYKALSKNLEAENNGLRLDMSELRESQLSIAKSRDTWKEQCAKLREKVEYLELVAGVILTIVLYQLYQL